MILLKMRKIPQQIPSRNVPKTRGRAMTWYKSVFPVVPIISIVIITGCGQSAPKNTELKTSLQNTIPSYWEVASFKIENRENLGTRTNPVIQARFQSLLKLKEDTFTYAERLESIDYARQRDVKFISLVTEKGETVELYGFANSRLFQDSWQTEFEFDQYPISELGKPRSSFKGKTVLRNSPEEEKFIAEVEQQIALEKEAILSKLFSRNQEGIFRGRRTSYFTIHFSSVDKNSGKVAGEITFKSRYRDTISAVKSFEGTLSNQELKFTVNKAIKEDNFGIGTVYNFPVDNLEGKPRKIEGTWKHIDGNTGKVSINLDWDN